MTDSSVDSMIANTTSRVKICGLTRETDLRVAVEAGADAVGVICDVSVETPREVNPERARTLFAAAPPFVSTVLVTMAADSERVLELLESTNPDVLQLHGEVDTATLETVQTETAVDVVLTVDAAAIETATEYDERVDALLVDSVDADGGGGTGETHDWERTRAATAALESPVILAGGLTPENVAEAVGVVQPFAVDVASGVEASGGIKDHEAVRAFVARARAPTTAPIEGETHR